MQSDQDAIDIRDFLAEPIPPETAEQAYRRGFTDAVEQLAFGGAPISQEAAEAWFWRCRKWRSGYEADPAVKFPPRCDEGASH